MGLSNPNIFSFLSPPTRALTTRGYPTALTQATFNGPCGIAVSPNGVDIYIGERMGNSIRKLTNGVVSTFAGLPDEPNGHVNGLNANARFSAMYGLDISADGLTLFVIEYQGVCGETFLLAGTGIGGWLDGPFDAARFNYPTSIVVSGYVDGSRSLVTVLRSQRHQFPR